MGAKPSVLRELGIYGGAQGIWVDKARTTDVVSDGQGVTVALLHKGTRYADDLSEDCALYHYPQTARPEGRDRGEIEATKWASRLSLPVFFIARSERRYAVRRIVRDSALTRALKALAGNKCQLCGVALELPGGKLYSEAHHIQPLGGGHGGPDVAENIIVVCPNCHALCDFGAVQLDLRSLRRSSDHVVERKYVDYHNSHIYHASL